MPASYQIAKVVDINRVWMDSFSGLFIVLQNTLHIFFERRLPVDIMMTEVRFVESFLNAKQIELGAYIETSSYLKLFP